MNSTTRIRPISTRRKSRRRGQAMIETGAVIIALLLLSMGLLQYGIIYNATLSLNNLAREGARFAAVHGRDADARDKTIARLKQKASGTSIDPNVLNSTTVAITSATGSPTLVVGEVVKVEITYNLRENKIFVPVVFPGMSQAQRDRLTNYKVTAQQNIE